MNKILVTGADGFLGSALCNCLQNGNHHVVKVCRTSTMPSVNAIGDMSCFKEWSSLLVGVDTIVHCAAQISVTSDLYSEQLIELRRVNVDATLNLARQAVLVGVRRFLFISSIKVNGEGKLSREAYTTSDLPAPEDAYATSKAEAERGLLQLAEEMGLEVVIIRPPLVYGPRVKGNFLRMLSWLQRGVPLPLRCVTENRRSLVALDNLVDLLVTCVDHPAAANKTFLVSDGEDLSTADLLRRLGKAMGKRARLLPVPLALLQTAAKLLGKGDMAQRLLGNLQVDISHTCQTLGWNPPISVDEGLRRAVKGFNE